MLNRSPAPLPVVLAATLLPLLGGCVTTNPEWDPAAAEAQSDTGGDDETPGHTTTTSGPDVPNDGDEGPLNDEGEGEGDGEGDGDGDGDGSGDGPGDGDGDSGNDGGNEGDGDGEDLVCGHVSASFGLCPASCDKCDNGICFRYCGESECNNDFLVCPVGWSCRVLCLGQASCKDTTVACTGWGSCEVECMGNDACTEADILCAGGPCNVNCGDFDKPCENLDVRCGSNVTRLHCDAPYEGAAPGLDNEEFAECECSSDCVAKN